MQEQVGNVSRETKILRIKKSKMLDIKNNVKAMKNVFDGHG